MNPREPDPGPPVRLAMARARSDPSHGHHPEERPIAEHLEYGIVVLDKPSGPSSHQVAAWAREAPSEGKTSIQRRCRPRWRSG